MFIYYNMNASFIRSNGLKAQATQSTPLLPITTTTLYQPYMWNLIPRCMIDKKIFFPNIQPHLDSPLLSFIQTP